MVNNKLTSIGNSLLIGATNTLSTLQLIGNHITGVTSIPDSSASTCILKDNYFKGTTVLPTNNDTTKIIKDNLISA